MDTSENLTTNLGIPQYAGNTNTDPWSKRQKLKRRNGRKGFKKGDKSLKDHTKGNGENGSQDTSEAPPVTGLAPTHCLGNKICVLYVSNLRRLRYGLRLFFPGVIMTSKRIRKPYRGVIGKSLLDIRDRNILTSEVIRSSNMRTVLTENFLDKGARKLAVRLSELPGKTAASVIKKPQCFRLNDSLSSRTRKRPMRKVSSKLTKWGYRMV